jgi:hypothetical protein
MEEVQLLRLGKLVIEPSMLCPLDAPLSLAIEGHLLVPVARAVWEITYEADFTNKRHVIHVFRSQSPVDMSPGPFQFAHHIESIRTEGVKERHLLQVGVLKVQLRSEADPSLTASVNMVTQVTKDTSTGQLLRVILSPLE